MRSTDGCLANGRPLSHAAHELVDGDIVKMGDLEFRFELKKP